MTVEKDNLVEIMRQSVAAVGRGNSSFGLLFCCFASAWKRPDDRDWSAWLDGLPAGVRRDVARGVATGLRNASVGEPDPSRRRALADRIDAIRTRLGHDPAVRKQLARALSNATVIEPDPAQRRALADRLDALHTQFGFEPAVREHPARALSGIMVQTARLAGSGSASLPTIS